MSTYETPLRVLFASHGGEIAGALRTLFLGEAYSSAITAVDLGVVSRCDQFSSLLKTIIHSYANPNGQFLDYGGGYGMLVRRMRDLGYDYYWADKHCENLFASGFDVTHRTEGCYELLTAFEVFEHLTDPVGEMEVMTGLADQIVFSTDMISRPPPCARHLVVLRP